MYCTYEQHDDFYADEPNPPLEKLEAKIEEQTPVFLELIKMCYGEIPFDEHEFKCCFVELCSIFKEVDDRFDQQLKIKVV